MAVSYPTAQKLASAVVQGDRRALSQAITLVESDNPEHRQKAGNLLEILQHQLKDAKPSFRLGLSGSPGVGKSTFTEAVGLKLLEKGHKLAVLAIDPSSARDGGSILADKTRMPKLAVEKNAYIRPSPSRAALGGVARQTYDTIILCEAAGFDRIIIETVGVGQSEVAVAEMCDFFLLLLLPESGDEFQALKRGIMQMVDCVLVNKTDGKARTTALRTAAEYSSALRLMPPRIEGWQVPVLNVSALKGTGLDQVMDTLNQALKYLTDNDLLFAYRTNQNRNRLLGDVILAISDRIKQDPEFQKHLNKQAKEIMENGKPTNKAVAEVLKKIKFS